MKTPSLSIIIVHWNTPGVLTECLASLVENEKKLEYEVIVVDNGSVRDISPVEEAFPDGSNGSIRFMRLEKNIGFGRGCNYGVKSSKAETLLFLGPDTRLIERDTLIGTYQKFLSVPDVGAFSCSLLNNDGSPQKHYFNFPEVSKIIGEWWHETTNHIPFVFKKRRNQSPKLLEEVDMVIAHCLMISKKVFLDAGGFPENAFMFGDDIEINKRIQKKGYHNYLYRGEVLIHHSGQAGVVERYGKRRVHIIQDSIFRFNVRHHGIIYAVFATALIMLRATSNILLLGPLYMKKGLKEFLWDNWIIIWHYLAYQWCPRAIRKIAGT